ncbi:tyrosine-type recombinase/integrase [Thermoactinospora rubra]|uniref:tyrosine-type recombinase/integrase n=1 Tax=Thermoactinospora rubra TaxID=1088767 RepID=UPI001F0B4955|nr:site-specific integrase [Thermoactinospora rubra]
MVSLKPPKLDQKITPVLSDDQIKACAGPDMWDRRGEAIVRLMVETGARAGEIVGMMLDDIDLKTGMATVRRGKGGKGRRVPFSPQTGRALDRYLRARRTHRLASTPVLWLGDRGKTFSYDGLYSTLRHRADRAGIPDFHPHMMRHTAASRWLAAGGSEGGLMAVAGWSRREMIDRYTRATSERRAADEARALNLATSDARPHHEAPECSGAS